MGVQTTVHLLRHGEVHNPEGVLYGRRDGFHLSDLGNQMAQRIAESIGDRDIVHMRTSPLERAQETGAPLAAARGLDAGHRPAGDRVDQRVRGASASRDGAMTFVKRPHLLRHMYNPFKPSWGEPYDEIAGADGRRRSTTRATRRAGHEAVIVSHQLPIWTTRLFLEKRSYLHHPKNRQCTLCSLTSVVFDDDRMVQVRYSEPAGDLIPVGDRSAPFSAGGAPQEDRP